MVYKTIVFAACLVGLVGCQRQPNEVHASHRADSRIESPNSAATAPQALQPAKIPAPPPNAALMNSPVDCYLFARGKTASQRANAVQERLRQADQMSATLDPHIIAVDLVGDHANILSMRFAVKWPADLGYAGHVRAIIQNYFSSPAVVNGSCDAGFSKIELSAVGVNDGLLHSLWTAQFTSEGLLTLSQDGKSLLGSPSGSGKDDVAASGPEQVE